jgi:hypothetical protein
MDLKSKMKKLILDLTVFDVSGRLRLDPRSSLLMRMMMDEMSLL